MSTTVADRHPGRFSGLPTWSAIAIVCAALVTGLLLSLTMVSIGAAFLWLFAVSSVVVTLLVNPRGLFLTVASLPLLFGVGLLAASWAVNRAQSAEGAPLFTRTTVLITLYPLTQFFPWVALVTVLCAVIAVVRLMLLRRRGALQERSAQSLRTRMADADRRNRSLSSSARRRSEQLTVQELLERNRSRDRSRDR